VHMQSTSKFCWATSLAFFLPNFLSSSRCSISLSRRASDLARYSIYEDDKIFSCTQWTPKAKNITIFSDGGNTCCRY
jgi:hypothetical protein